MIKHAAAITLGLVLFGCMFALAGQPAAPAEVAPPQRVTPGIEQPQLPSPFPKLTRPVGAIAPLPGPPGDCEIELITATEQHPDGHWELIARAKSWASTPLDVSLPVTCPGGPVRFEGLPRSYDYFGTCAMGACLQEPRGRSPLRIAPREIVELARVRVEPRGGSCTPALAPGQYEVRFTVDLRGATTCAARTALIEVTREASPPPHRRPSPPAPTRRQMKCPPMPACGIACNGPQSRDENGCLQCSCEQQDIIGD